MRVKLSFAMDSTNSQFVRREQLRARCRVNDAVIINVLPSRSD
jgi:hypothetical protein